MPSGVEYHQPFKKGGEYQLQKSLVKIDDVVKWEDVEHEKLGYTCHTKMTMNDGRILWAVERQNDMKIVHW